jgi:hypothetical protein
MARSLLSNATGPEAFTNRWRAMPSTRNMTRAGRNHRCTASTCPQPAMPECWLSNFCHHGRTIISPATPQREKLAKPYVHALQVSCLPTWGLFYSLVVASCHRSNIFLLGEVTFMVYPSIICAVVPTCIGKTRGEGFCAVARARVEAGQNLQERGCEQTSSLPLCVLTHVA